MTMHVLIVHTHPEPTAFTAALKDVAVRALSAAGHRIEVSDLYAEGFNPVAGRHDFVCAADPARFHYQSEQLNASRTGSFAADLVREQERLMRADLLVFTFPLWWRNQYLHGWEEFLLATAGDRERQARLRALADTTAQNRLPIEERAWAAQR